MIEALALVETWPKCERGGPVPSFIGEREIEKRIALDFLGFAEKTGAVIACGLCDLYDLVECSL